MTTTPNLGIPLLDGAAINDWRDINSALEEVDTAVAAELEGLQPAGDYLTAVPPEYLTQAEADAAYLTAAGADALFLTPAEGDAAYATADHTHPQVTTGRYHFQTNPAMTDPGTGNFRSNTGLAATATSLAMDQIGALGTDISTLFNAMREGDTVFVQDLNDADDWVRYQLTAGPTIHSGWAQVPVGVVSNGGLIAGSELCVLQLTLTAGGGGGGGTGVTSVNGETGVVVLDAADVGALTQAAGDARYEPLDSAYTKAEADTRYVNTTGSEAMAGPLAINGKSVAVSATANNDLTWNSDGFYLDAPTKAHGHTGPASGGTLDYLPLAGGTLTGTAAFTGAAVAAGGAVRVTGVAVDARLYGASTPALSTAALSSAVDAGVRFHPSAAANLVAARWYRHSAAQPAPLAVRLWDSTSTLTPVWSVSAPTEFTNTAVGWKEYRLPTPQALVSGRGYTLSYGGATPGDGVSYDDGYVPTPDSPLVFEAHAYAGSLATYPTTVSPAAYLIDPVVRLASAGSDPAEQGAIRLPNGAQGVVAWRNAADSADLSLGMDATDALAVTVGAASLTTSATAGAASALPGVPAGYLTVVINGTARKIGFWAT